MGRGSASAGAPDDVEATCGGWDSLPSEAAGSGAAGCRRPQWSGGRRGRVSPPVVVEPMVLADPDGVSVGVIVMGDRVEGEVTGAASPAATVGMEPALHRGGTADTVAEAEPGTQ